LRQGPCRLFDQCGAPVNPLRPKACVLLELPGSLSAADGNETLQRALAKLADPALEQQNQERARNEEGEEEAEEKAGGEAAPGIETFLQAREQPHERFAASPADEQKDMSGLPLL
jgi:hypothetical protein